MMAGVLTRRFVECDARRCVQVWQYSVCLTEMDYACRVASFSLPAAAATAAASDASKGDFYTLHACALPFSQRVGPAHWWAVDMWQLLSSMGY
jgi:hypothetical protein